MEGLRKGGRGGAKWASSGGVEYRRRRVKVADCCRVHRAHIPSGSKSVSSPGAAKKGDWKLERDSRGY